MIVRWFIHPSPIAALEADGSPVRLPDGTPLVWQFAPWFGRVVDASKRFNETGAGIRASIRLLDALKATKPGEPVGWDEADWREAHAEIEAPAMGFPVFELVGGGKRSFARDFIRWVDAVANASPTKPTVTAASAETDPGAS